MPQRKKVLEWLQSQRAYTLHKPARKKFPTRKTRTSHHNSQWQADLNDMMTYKEGSYRYILTVIDVFSRYAWARALKTKTGEEMVEALQNIFQEGNVRIFYRQIRAQSLKTKNFKPFFADGV